MPKRIKERVRVGTDENGQPIYKWVTGSNMQEVFENAFRLMNEYKKEDAAKAPSEKKEKHLFKQYAQQWFETFKKPTLRDITAVNYEQQLVKHIYPFFGEMYIEDIASADIQNFLNDRSAFAKDTQQKHLNIIRMILDSAVEDGLIASNPGKSQKIKLTSSAREEREPLSKEQMRQIISKIPQVVDTMERCFIAIQALHGMRPCEVLGLKWEDIDLENRTISIKRDVVHPKRNLPVVSDTKTQLSKRKLTISNIAMPYIVAAAQTVHASEHPESFVFGGREPLSYSRHRNMMRRICRQMGVENVTGYVFRHTVITDIYETTHDANIAAAVAGHSKTSMTMDRYSHARKDSAQKGMQAFDRTYTV